MKAIKRWRYYCDHCKKAGQSGFHMKNHESSCTLNPERVCKMCVLLNGGTNASLAEMLAVLPDPAVFMRPHSYLEGLQLDEEAMKLPIAEALRKLREMSEGCPVCILAALRQKKIPVPMVEGFDFKSEMKGLFDDINTERRECAGY